MKKNPNGPGASAPWLAARFFYNYIYGIKKGIWIVLMKKMY